jgi:hypothetical protein
VVVDGRFLQIERVNSVTELIQYRAIGSDRLKAEVTVEIFLVQPHQEVHVVQTEVQVGLDIGVS